MRVTMNHTSFCTVIIAFHCYYFCCCFRIKDPQFLCPVHTTFRLSKLSICRPSFLPSILPTILSSLSLLFACFFPSFIFLILSSSSLPFFSLFLLLFFHTGTVPECPPPLCVGLILSAPLVPAKIAHLTQKSLSQILPRHASIREPEDGNCSDLLFVFRGQTLLEIIICL